MDSSNGDDDAHSGDTETGIRYAIVHLKGHIVRLLDTPTVLATFSATTRIATLMAAIALGSKITAAVHLTVVRAWLSILATVIVTSGATTRSVILMEAIAPVSRLMWAVHLQDLFVPLTKLPIERATLAAITRNASGMTALVRAVRSAYLLGRVQSSILTAFRVRTTPHTTAITR